MSTSPVDGSVHKKRGLLARYSSALSTTSSTSSNLSVRRSPVSEKFEKTTAPRPSSWFLPQRALAVDTDQPHFGTIPKRSRAYSRDGARPFSLLGSRSSRSNTSSPILPPTSNPDANWHPRDYPEKPLVNVHCHGEVQTSNSGWRKKSEYLVLTETHLLRFKNHKRAFDAFPSIIPPHAHQRRHTSSSSMGSMIEGHQAMFRESSPEPHVDRLSGVPLHQIVAVHIVNDGKPRSTLELIWLNQDTNIPFTLIFHFDDVMSHLQWLGAIREATAAALVNNRDRISAINRRMICDAIRPVSGLSNEDLEKIHIVAQRTPCGVDSHISLDDLSSKLLPIIFFLVIGTYRIHLVPLIKASHSSSRSLDDGSFRSSAFGIVTISLLTLSSRDDAFDLCFRKPQQNAVSFEFASATSQEFSIQLRHAYEHLHPNWFINPNIFRIPREVFSNFAERIPLSLSPEQSFALVLTSHCVAFDIDVDDICYFTSLEGEDTPLLQILPPRNGEEYSLLQLICIMRAMRYINYFRTISFSHVSLERLRSARDWFGDEHTWIRPLMGPPLEELQDKLAEHRSSQPPLLVDELRAVVLTNKKLRRLDFTACLSRQPQTRNSNSGALDSGSGIAEALYPLMCNQNTVVDWIIFNDIPLATADLNFLIGILCKRECHIRALEVSGCGLNTFDLRLMLGEMPTQRNTLECINIANNPGRLSPEIVFCGDFAQCQALRSVNLSRLAFFGDEPVVAFDVMRFWRLEELHFSRTKLNAETLKALILYLRSPMSNPLSDLRLDYTGLQTHDIHSLISAIAQKGGSRKLHLDLTGNGRCAFSLLEAQKTSTCGPISLTANLLDFPSEHVFRDFLDLIRNNRTLQCLDIAQPMLGSFQIGADTTRALERMFAENNTLTHLDLSGEQSRLETTNLGASLTRALRGLEHNSTLRVLKLCDQGLGHDGANVLARVLARNQSLSELHVERNGIPLVGFAAMVDVLRSGENTTLTYMSDLEDGIRASMAKVQRAVDNLEMAPSSGGGGGRGNGSINLSQRASTSRSSRQKAASAAGRPKALILNRLSKSGRSSSGGSGIGYGGGKGGGGTSRRTDFAHHADSAKKYVAQRWHVQQRWLEACLERNRRMVAGERDVPVEVQVEGEEAEGSVELEGGYGRGQGEGLLVAEMEVSAESGGSGTASGEESDARRKSMTPLVGPGKGLEGGWGEKRDRSSTGPLLSVETADDPAFTDKLNRAIREIMREDTRSNDSVVRGRNKTGGEHRVD